MKITVMKTTYSKMNAIQWMLIEHNTQLRDALTLLVDGSLIKYGLQTEDEIKNFKRKTLFDTEVKIKEV